MSSEKPKITEISFANLELEDTLLTKPYPTIQKIEAAIRDKKRNVNITCPIVRRSGTSQVYMKRQDPHSIYLEVVCVCDLLKRLLWSKYGFYQSRFCQNQLNLDRMVKNRFILE